jgi:hypothetical protein
MSTTAVITSSASTIGTTRGERLPFIRWLMKRSM